MCAVRRDNMQRDPAAGPGFLQSESGSSFVAQCNVTKNDCFVFPGVDHDDEPVKEFLNDDLLEGEDVKFKVKTFIKMSLWDYIKQILAS